MISFFNRLFKRRTAENQLLLALLPIVVVLILLDNSVDQLTLSINHPRLVLSILKFILGIPIVAYVIFLLSNILDHKLSESRIALETSEERFRTIFENNSSAIVIIQKDSTVSMVNKAYCEMTGYTQQEVVGKSWHCLIPESELERLTRYNRLRLEQSSEAPSIYEFKFQKKNGEIRVGLMSVFYDQLINQIVTSITDISERKEMEISLGESREKYRKLIEMQGEGLAIVDKEERFIFTNPAADRIMGFPLGGLTGRRLNEFVSSETFEMVQKQTETRAEGNQSTYEMELTRPDGETRVLLVTATPTFNAVGEFESSLGIFIDITDRKKIENELKKNESELKALNTTKDKLFSIIAHDLRGPVGTSADLLEVMIENFENFSKDEQYKMLEILGNSAKSTFNLLETLLNWSVIQTGNLVFKPELFNLTKCIESVVDNMIPTAFSKNITLSFKNSEEVFTYADQNMIQTILRNLIGNAIKYTYRDGNVMVKLAVADGKTEISVSDDGMGMDENVTKKLFVLNSQNSIYGTENEKGTGLGLILCKEFIERHGGHIRVESEIGKGSNFIFDIPQIYKQADSNAAKNKEENPELKKFNNELVLIVEDESINYQVLSSILASVNLRYERAENGKQAVDMFLHNNYRLILMDIQLSGMNGWEATMKIRENDSEIPIIAVTAFASDPARKKSMEAGCNDYVTKPVNKAKLVTLIDKYLKRGRISSPIMSE